MQWLQAALAYFRLDLVVTKAATDDTTERLRKASTTLLLAIGKRYSMEAEDITLGIQSWVAALYAVGEWSDTEIRSWVDSTFEDARERYEKDLWVLLAEAVGTIYTLSKLYQMRKVAGIEDSEGFTETTPKASEAFTAKSLAPYKSVAKVSAEEFAATFEVRDFEAIAALSDFDHTFWVGEGHWSTEAFRAEIVALVRDKILVEGLTQDEIAAKVRELVGEAIGTGVTPTSSVAYARMFAVNVVNVAKTYGSIFGLADSGVTRYTIENPQDERTCPVCSYLAGTTQEVAAAVESLVGFIGADAEEIKDGWRWSSNGQDLTSITGKSDAADLTKADMGKIGAAGFRFPPFHGGCRCVVEADFDAPISWPSDFEPSVLE